MNATLLDNPEQSACGSRGEAELTALVEKLLAEVAQLRGEVAELRQQAGYWKGMFEQTKRKNEKLQKEIDSLRAENRQLKDRLFAAKSEKKPRRTDPMVSTIRKPPRNHDGRAASNRMRPGLGDATTRTCRSLKKRSNCRRTRRHARSVASRPPR
ncbi:hypothetical protein LCGC14_2369000 [marine sediment metagenome]|uniref:Transposase TnpC homeodomain domain-containing protein n=1 Tax=marine sediment metagenome TaxID=412755 RepID=A0A0F9C4H9_9ZZZZ